MDENSKVGWIAICNNGDVGLITKEHKVKDKVIRYEGIHVTWGMWGKFWESKNPKFIKRFELDEEIF